MSNPNPIDQIIDFASGASEADPADAENRSTRRCEYGAPVAFVQWTPTGGKSIATIVSTKNISSTGVCVTSRYMLHVGHEGVLLMRRSNGEEVLVGVKVVHSNYVGDMKHESGLSFIKVPANLVVEDFRDENGNMPNLGSARAA